MLGFRIRQRLTVPVPSWPPFRLHAMRYPLRVLSHARSQVHAVMRAQGRHHARLRDRVAAIVFATIGIDVICAVLAYVLEHDQKRTQIHSFGSAIFWTT